MNTEHDSRPHGTSSNASESAAIALNGLGLIKLARAAQSVQGQEQIHRLSRFYEGQPQQASGATLRWVLEGVVPQDEGGVQTPAIVLTGNAQVQLACQRCLGVLEQEIRFETKLFLVRSEQEADRIDALLEQLGEENAECLVLEPDFQFTHLLEDELIMATPFAPMHEQCPDQVAANDQKPVQVAVPGTFEQQTEPTRKSLAGLGDLLKRKQ